MEGEWGVVEVRGSDGSFVKPEPQEKVRKGQLVVDLSMFGTVENFEHLGREIERWLRVEHRDRIVAVRLYCDSA